MVTCKICEGCGYYRDLLGVWHECPKCNSEEKEIDTLNKPFDKWLMEADENDPIITWIVSKK